MDRQVPAPHYSWTFGRHDCPVVHGRCLDASNREFHRGTSRTSVLRVSSKALAQDLFGRKSTTGALIPRSIETARRELQRSLHE